MRALVRMFLTMINLQTSEIYVRSTQHIVNTEHDFRGPYNFALSSIVENAA